MFSSSQSALFQRQETRRKQKLYRIIMGIWTVFVATICWAHAAGHLETYQGLLPLWIIGIGWMSAACEQTVRQTLVRFAAALFFVLMVTGRLDVVVGQIPSVILLGIALAVGNMVRWILQFFSHSTVATSRYTPSHSRRVSANSHRQSSPSTGTERVMAFRENVAMLSGNDAEAEIEEVGISTLDRFKS